MATKADSKLQRAMRDSLNAYANGDKRFFDYLSDNVRVYSLNSAEPTIGRKAFESAFARTFKTKRKVNVLNSDLQPSEGRAVLSQTLEVSVEGIDSVVRQTVIWEQGSDGNWKMSHIHNAQVGQPIVTGRAPRTAADVRVLNERIATVAAAVGVAQ